MDTPDNSCHSNNAKRAEEIERCTREAAFLEAQLQRNPGQNHLWVLRSELYQHLSCTFMLSGYTTEQLFFGAYVAGMSEEKTIKAAYSFSFLSEPHYKKLREIATDNTQDVEE